jgi:hypothetical protein
MKKEKQLEFFNFLVRKNSYLSATEKEKIIWLALKWFINVKNWIIILQDKKYLNQNNFFITFINFSKISKNI